MSASQAVPRVRHAEKARRTACHDGNGEPSRPKMNGASCAKGGGHGAPARAVGGAQRVDARRVGFGILVHAEPGAVGERRGEAALGDDEIKSVRDETILVRGKKRRAGEHAEIHGVKVVAKAGERDLAGLDRAAGGSRALAHRDLPALAGEMKRGRQPVDARADHDCVRMPCALFPAPLASLASADIS